MTQNVITIKNLHKKATNETLTSLFESYGPVKHIGMYDDPAMNGNKCAEITFQTSEQAQNAVTNMNEKEIFLKKIVVELKAPNSSKSFLIQKPAAPSISQETIGAKIFPIAKQKYESDAPKITGMLIESILKHKDKADTQAILNSEQDIKELIDSAYKKLHST